MIDHLFEISHYVKEKIEHHPRLKLISSQYLNNCFQVIPANDLMDANQFTLKVRTHLVQKGVALVNYVELPNKSIFFRLVTANNTTEKIHIDQLFKEFDLAISKVDLIGNIPPESN
jgi:hypothetical protein